MPVFPAVPSTITPPGFSRPRASASRTIPSAARSFTEPPGFMNSALPRISQPVSSDGPRSLINGVLPMASRTFASTPMPLPPLCLLGQRGELVRLVFAGQRLDDLVEIAGHDFLNPVEGEVDAVIGDPALREIVRADAL